MKNLANKLHKLEDCEFKEEMKKNYSKDQKKVRNKKGNIPVEGLPFKFEALKRFVDSETMSYHYNKHYISFVNKLNDLLNKSDNRQDDLEVLIVNINDYDSDIRNNAGGAYNHSIFWKMLSTNHQEPDGLILKLIGKFFGSVKDFKKKFEALAKDKFNSGWIWLILTDSGALKLVITSDNENPLMLKLGFPLLGLDLWEHAYYLTYKDKKERYVENFWKVVNWDYVNEKLIEQQNKILEKNMVEINEFTPETYSKENWGGYLNLYKQNKELFDVYSKSIENILSEVFHENSGTNNGMSGIYDIESPGWSVLNKLNTNMLGFTILVTDINTVLDKSGIAPISLLKDSITKSEIKSELIRFIEFIDKFKYRIFDRNSKVFRKLISALSDTTKKGDLTETISFDILRRKFGDTNVKMISGYGERKDMIGGVDIEIRVNGLLAQAQIKPAKEINEDGGLLFIIPSSSIKQYKTDWLIFEQNAKLYILSNKNTKIKDGGYEFGANDLLYILD